jgi:Rrf2 family protein
MFSTTTQYALRAVVHMARLPKDSWILGRDLAERASVPVHYLSKILLTLRNADLVETTRGHGGGYRLARPADEIKLIEIAQLFEVALSRPSCLLGESRECSDQHGCSAHFRWKHVQNTYLDFLTTTTIADVA